MSSTAVSSKLYEILCLPPFSSIPEIRTAYKTLAVKYHPDKNLGDPEAGNKFRIVKEAYELLSNEEKKKKYDLRLQMAMRTATTSKKATQSPSSLSSTYKAFFQMNNMSPTRRQRRTETSTKGRGNATGTANRGAAAGSTNTTTTPAGSTPGYSTNHEKRSRPVPKPEENTTTGAAATESRPPRTASRRRNMEDMMGSSTAGSAAGNARGTHADASQTCNHSFRSFPSGLGSRGGSRAPTPHQPASKTAPLHTESSSPPPLHRVSKLTPEERLRRLKEAHRAEQEKQEEIQRRRDAQKALQRQREELREEQRRKREEERLAKQHEEQERSKREYERWQQNWEKEETERQKAYADREARHQHQEEGVESLLNDWKAHVQQSSLLSHQKLSRRTLSSLTSSSDLHAGNSPGSISRSDTPAEPGSPDYHVEGSPDIVGSHRSPSASSLTFSPGWSIPDYRKGMPEGKGNPPPSSAMHGTVPLPSTMPPWSSSLGSVEGSSSSPYDSGNGSGNSLGYKSTWTPMTLHRPEKNGGSASGGVPRTFTNRPVCRGGRQGEKEEQEKKKKGGAESLSSLFHSADPESGVPRVIRLPGGFQRKGPGGGPVVDDGADGTYVLAQKRGVIKRSAMDGMGPFLCPSSTQGSPPSFSAPPQDDRSPMIESSDEGEGSLGSTPPGGSSSDSLKAPPLSDVERKMQKLHRERWGMDQGVKGEAGGTNSFSFRFHDANFQELENQFRQFSTTRSRRASVGARNRRESEESEEGEAKGSPFTRRTPGGTLNSAPRMRTPSALRSLHRSQSPLSHQENRTGLLFPGSSYRHRPPSYPTAENKGNPMQGGGLGSAHYLEDESSLVREEQQLARDRQRVEELLYSPMAFSRGVSSRRNSRQLRRDSVSGEEEASSTHTSSSGSKCNTKDSSPLLSSDASDFLRDSSHSTPTSPPSKKTSSPLKAEANAVDVVVAHPKRATTVPSKAAPFLKERPPPPPPPPPPCGDELSDDEGGSELLQLIQEEHNVRVHEVENVERIALRSILRRFPALFVDIPLLSLPSPSMVSGVPLHRGGDHDARKAAAAVTSKPSTPAHGKDAVESLKERGDKPPPIETLSPPNAPPSVPVVSEKEKLLWESERAQMVHSEMHFRNIIARSQHNSSAFMFLHSAEKLGRLATIALDQWERRKLAKLASIEYYQSMKSGIESSTGMQRDKWVPLKIPNKKVMKSLSSSTIKILPVSSEAANEVESEKTSQNSTIIRSPPGNNGKGASSPSSFASKGVSIASNTTPQTLPSGSPKSASGKLNLRKVSGKSVDELADAATLVAQKEMKPRSLPTDAEKDPSAGNHPSTANTSTHPSSVSPHHSGDHPNSGHSSVGSSGGVPAKAKPTISLQRSPEDEPNASSSCSSNPTPSPSGSFLSSSLTAVLQQSEEKKRGTVEDDEATLFCTLMQHRAAQLHAVYQKEKENAILAALTAFRTHEEKS